VAPATVRCECTRVDRVPIPTLLCVASRGWALDRLSQQHYFATIKIGAMALLAASVVLTIAVTVLYFVVIDHLLPLDFVAGVELPSDHRHPWQQLPPTTLPRVIDTIGDTSDNSEAEQALPNECHHNERVALLYFPELANVSGSCWADLSTGAFRPGSSITDCGTAAAHARMLWCCVSTLPYGSLGVGVVRCMHSGLDVGRRR